MKDSTVPFVAGLLSSFFKGFNAENTHNPHISLYINTKTVLVIATRRQTQSYSKVMPPFWLTNINSSA